MGLVAGILAMSLKMGLLQQVCVTASTASRWILWDVTASLPTKTPSKGKKKGNPKGCLFAAEASTYSGLLAHELEPFRLDNLLA